jgi:hypothetical protein
MSTPTIESLTAQLAELDANLARINAALETITKP